MQSFDLQSCRQRAAIPTEMCFRNFFCLQLLIVSCAENINVIRDYFVFKGVSRVAGFSCGDIQSDYKLMKFLNDDGIAVSISQLKSAANISEFLHTRYWNLGIFLDLRCSISEKDLRKLFYETSKDYMFGHLHQWLILGKNMSRTTQLLNQTTFSVTTDIVIATPQNDNYILYDVYNRCERKGGLLNVTEFGTWTKNDGLNVTLLSEKFTRRWDFHGMKLKVVGLTMARPKNQSLVDYLLEHSGPITDYWGKLGYSLMIPIKRMFNFNIETAEFTTWSKYDANGPHISSVAKNLFDLEYWPSFITQQRLGLAKVIIEIFYVRTCFMFLTVPTQRMDMDIIFRPFERDVWYVTLLLTFIIIIILYTILKLEENVEDSESTVLIILGAICQQGYSFASEKYASRVAFFQTLIFGLLVYNCYSAAVVSSRLNVPLNKMNDSLVSLVDSKIELAAFKEIFLDFLVSAQRDDVRYFKKLWDTIPEEKKYHPLEDGIKRIMKPGFAYHTNPNNAYPIIERTFDEQMICQLTEVHLLGPTTVALWASPHSHFVEIVKIGLLRVSSSGIRKREVIRWNSRKPYCNPDNHYLSSVTIIEAMPIILVLLFGMILSGVICFMEHAVFRILHRKPIELVIS